MRFDALGRYWLAVVPLLAAGLASCDGPQSALSPAGEDAGRIAHLFAWMFGGAVVIWLGVMGSALYAVVRGEREHSERTANLFVLGGGVALPTVTLTVLLVFGLSMMPSLLHPGAELRPRVRVSAEQWWWRVTYRTDDGDTVELANELRVPVRRRLSVSLASPDVVHSFWVPSLAGKVDAIPGRVTHLAFEPTRTGVFRGACAEYCGESHALMAFYVEVTSEQAYEAWLRHQAEPARPPDTALGARGAGVFLSSGCGACHAVRGTTAEGVLGPDLTHVGSRRSLGAGTLENDVEAFQRWLTHTDEVKPGVHMPTYHALEDGAVRALATYLDGLE